MRRISHARARSKAKKAHDRAQSESPKGKGLQLANPRREQILIAASRLFVKRGFAGTSMQDIADAVRITKAGLYHFVNSKEDLLYEIMIVGMDVLSADVVAPAKRIEDPLERLKTILRNHMLNVSRIESANGNTVTIVVDDVTELRPEQRKVVNRRKREYFEFVRQTLRDLQARGQLADVDVSVAAFSLLGMVLWMARWRRPDGALSLDEIVDNIIAVSLHGVLKIDASSGPRAVSQTAERLHSKPSLRSSTGNAGHAHAVVQLDGKPTGR